MDATDYRNQIKKKESPDYYVKIRGDTKRTFLTSEEYNSRVAEERLVRVLNSFVHRHDKPYCQGMDAIAAGYDHAHSVNMHISQSPNWFILHQKCRERESGSFYVLTVSVSVSVCVATDCCM